MKVLISLTVLGILLLYLGLLQKQKWLIPTAISGLILSVGLAVSDWNTSIRYFNDMIHIDNYSLAFNISMIISTILILLLANHYFKGVRFHVAEIYALIIFSLAGTYMMTSFSNIVMLFIGLETMSIPLYLLAGSKKISLKSNEASFKYFIMGSFATAVFLLGITLIYGTSGSFHLSKIADYIVANQSNLPSLFNLGLLLIIVGFSFKVAAAPFHFWAPDVYEGSPTLSTAFMATVVKTATFAAFYRLFSICFVNLSGYWHHTFIIIIVLTLLVGNLGAVRQTELKRMLAYSSIAHTGFILMALLAMNNLSASAIFYYSIAYSISTISAFGVLILVKNTQNSNGQIDAFNGLARNNPYMALMMTISMLSLAGIPITAGFFAKYYVFVAALKSNYLHLVIFSVFTALVGVYYYFQVIIAMYFKDGKISYIDTDYSYRTSLLLSGLFTVVLGIVPSIFISLI